MRPAAVALKMFTVWRNMLGKLDDTEKLLVELAVRHGGIEPAIEKWIEVSQKVESGEISQEERLQALFGQSLPNQSSKIEHIAGESNDESK